MLKNRRHNRSHNDVVSNATEEASETKLKEATATAKSQSIKKIKAVIQVKLFWDQNHWRVL